MLYKKLMNKNLLVGALVLSTLAGTVGCVGRSIEGKELVQKGNKTITVIKDTKNIVPEEISISEIQEYKGVIGYDWIDENTIVVTKENDKLDPIKTELGSFNIQNLFSYDLNSKEEKSISDQSKYQMGAVLSPNRNYMFYKNEYNGDNIGYISDVAGNRKVEITDGAIDEYDLSQVSWINDEELIMPCMSIKGFVIANIDGTLTKIKDVESGVMGTEDPLNGLSILNPIKVEDKIYYVTFHRGEKEDKKVNVYDIKTKEKKFLIEDDVFEVSLSPNKEQLLIVTSNEKKQLNELIVTDLEGKQREILDEGYIYGQTWSNDGTKVAYISYQEEKEGLSVIDLNTKEKTQIIAGEYFTPIKWSPSDKSIMVHSKMSKNNGKLFDEFDVTNVVSFK